jgi:hypothetical protein
LNYGSKQTKKKQLENDFRMDWGFGGIEFGFFGMGIYTKN